MFKFRYQSSKIFNVFTAVILVVLCLLLNKLTQINFRRIELPKNKPEFSATGINAHIYTPAGKLLYLLAAESGTQFPESQVIYLQQIKLQAFSESNNNLTEQLTSKNGWVNNQTQLGFLGESVMVILNNPDPAQITYIYTKNVDLDGPHKLATSSAPVRAVQKNSVLTGVGFSLDYKRKFLKIESQVKVVYVR